ncbi:hypothetical protein [Nocardiopsis sp. LOL_012]|uniref:hypothetical protein n=1 Tax=Nocardiopsis sp. LOL_012 TaxID=3345409 RepID=UPI003A881BFA
MARKTERARRPARSATDRTRTSARTRRLSKTARKPLRAPQPREAVDNTRSEHPITHWVLVDKGGRIRPEARWL